jgi:IclR family KDG regulon transcriptional repressor
MTRPTSASPKPVPAPSRSRPAPPASDPGSATGTVNRTLRLLAAFAKRERWPLNELATELELPRATTHRLLALCKPLGFIEQEPNGHYMAGAEWLRVAARITSMLPLGQVADPLLAGLRDETGESAMLVLLARQDLRMFFARVASPTHPLRYTVELNRLQPLEWGSAGRALLAYLSPEEVEDVVARHEPSPLDGRPLDERELRAALATIRKVGYAESYSQRAPDTHGIAVPFFDAIGQVRGNLILTIPHFRFDASRLDGYVASLRRAVDELTYRLGWS